MELLYTLTLLAQESGQGGGSGESGGGGAGGGLTLFIPLIIILVIFFWMQSRSQKKKRQEREELIDGIQVDDEVVTIGGFQGRVTGMDEDTFELCVDEENDVRMHITRQAVSGYVGEEDEEENT